MNAEPVDRLPYPIGALICGWVILCLEAIGVIESSGSFVMEDELL